MTSQDHINQARALRDRIISGQSNEAPIQAWAAVSRACANASNAYRKEQNGIHGRAQQSWLNNLDAIWWPARAQVETLARW